MQCPKFEMITTHEVKDGELVMVSAFCNLFVTLIVNDSFGEILLYFADYGVPGYQSFTLFPSRMKRLIAFRPLVGTEESRLDEFNVEILLTRIFRDSVNVDRYEFTATANLTSSTTGSSELIGVF